MKYIFRNKYLLVIGLLAFSFIACKRDASPFYQDDVKTIVFNGTALEYLQSQNGLYDTMVAVIQQYPDITASLKSSDKPMTVFAIPNNSFIMALDKFNTLRTSKDSAKLYFTGNVPSRIDYGRVHPIVLKEFISRYIFEGYYDFDALAKASAGYTIPSLDGYKMNVAGIQKSSVGSLNDGPKVIELSDVSNSLVQRVWRTVQTVSVNTAKAANTIIHALPSTHEFGFSSFTNRMMNPIIDRGIWKAVSWTSQKPTVEFGGTVYHAFDGNMDTRWETMAYVTDKIMSFVVDMGKNNTMTGVNFQNTQVYAQEPYRVTSFTIEFALDTAKNLSNESSWIVKYGPYTMPSDLVNTAKPWTFNFSRLQTARYFRYRTLATRNASQYCSVAEMSFNY